MGRRATGLALAVGAAGVALGVCVSPMAALATEEGGAPKPGIRRGEEDRRADQLRQRQLDARAEAIAGELAELRAKLIDLADEGRRWEDELAVEKLALDRLEAEEAAETTRLEEDRRRIGRLLAALQRLSRIPPEVVIATPEGPLDTLRSAVLLRDLLPGLNAQAQALAGVLNRLATVRLEAERRRAGDLAQRRAIAVREAEIAALVERREALSRQTDEERRGLAQRMARLGGQSGDLRQLMERVEAERRAAATEALARHDRERLEAERRALRESQRAKEAAPPQTAPPQTAPPQTASRELEAEEVQRLPVGGRLAVRFGETDRFGSISRGLTIAPRGGVTIVSPYPGTVMFAGPFKGYGQILIVEHANGYHSLIAGLGRIDTFVGERVDAGEPVGVTPTAADDSGELYFELRKHGQPVNPQRGFSAPEGKGQG